jgi:hypothetical protein
MTIATPGRTLEDGVACKPSYLGPPSGSRPFGQRNLLFVSSIGPELYIRAVRAPISEHGLILHPLPFHLFTIVVGLLELLFGLPLI